MKVLVTGGAGFVGSHVVEAYLDHGLEVVVVDDLSSGRLSHLDPRATFYRLDIRSTQLADVFHKERPDIVNHHAAQISARRSILQPIPDADVNILGSLNLLACCRMYHVRRFIYISSGGAVYGEPRDLPCDEAHPLDPICPYGVSKLAVEHYLNIYRANDGLDSVILRYANVYGPRQDPLGDAGVVAIFARQMLSGEQVVIHGDGEQQRDFVYVTDCARANLLALNHTQGGGIYNLGSGAATTVNEVAAALERLTGSTRRRVHGPARPGEVRRTYLNAERARRDLGWEPSVPLEQGLRLTVESFRASDRVAGR
jgi:UDP-glucose 4-epimerase